MAFTVPSGRLGEFGARGGSLVYVDWQPTPRQVEGAFLWLADYFDGTEVAMLQALEIAKRDTAYRFSSETDPDGEEWHELDPDYLYYKELAGYPSTILTRTGDLAAAAPDGWVILGDSLVYETGGLPRASDGSNYGLIHQNGTTDSFDDRAQKHRALVKERSNPKNKLLQDYEGGEHDYQGIERGMNLVARPWIGLSPEAIEAISAAFIRWFDAGIESMPWGPEAEAGFGGGAAVETAFAPAKYGGGELPVIGKTAQGRPIVNVPGVGARFGSSKSGLGL